MKYSSFVIFAFNESAHDLRDFWQPECVQYEKIVAEMKGQKCCQGDFILFLIISLWKDDDRDWI